MNSIKFKNLQTTASSHGSLFCETLNVEAREHDTGTHQSQLPLSSCRTFPDHLMKTLPNIWLGEARMPKKGYGLKFTIACGPVSLHFTILTPTHTLPSFGMKRIRKSGEGKSSITWCCPHFSRLCPAVVASSYRRAQPHPNVTLIRK